MYRHGTNNEFNPETCSAVSYGWWKYVSRVGDTVVFNIANYSQTTNKHQRATKKLLDSLGIVIDLEVRSRSGLQDPAWIEKAILDYEEEIVELKALIAKPGTKAAANDQRNIWIAELEATIEKLKALAA